MSGSDRPECFRVAELDPSEVQAIKAVWSGEANDYQQRLALATIVNKFARTHDLQFVPGAPDQSAVLSGRAFVGSQILKALNMGVGKLQNED